MKSAGQFENGLRVISQSSLMYAIRKPASVSESGTRFRGTKREAKIECARLISAVQAGTYLEPSKTTVAALSRSLARSHQVAGLAPFL